MEGEEWVVGATYTNKHNGGRIMVELREIMDSGTILFKAKRVGGADEGQITFLSKRDIRHWDMMGLCVECGKEDNDDSCYCWICDNCTKRVHDDKVVFDDETPLCPTCWSEVQIDAQEEE